MRLSVKRILTEVQGKMSAHNVFMKFQLAEFSIKAQPEALLSLSIRLQDGEKDIENVAQVAIPEENLFVLIPNEPSYVFPICKAIAFDHPEYKIERRVYNGKQAELKKASMDSTTNEEDVIIYCTMPEVNEDRRDAGMNLVKTLYEETDTAIDLANTDCIAQLSVSLAPYPEELKEAKDKLKEIYDKQKELCLKSKTDKEAEIEKAYQKYVDKQTHETRQQAESHEAKSRNAARSVSFDEMDE